MNEADIKNKPSVHAKIEAKCQEIGFDMPSDLYIGTLLKSLVASKPCGHFLELGTGIGLSLSWMADGIDDCGSIISIDNDPKLTGIVSQFFMLDSRVNILCQDGTEWIKNYSGDKFDLIFADAWPGKYSDLDETLALLKIGGIYVIDDMDEQPNWPQGHSEKAEELVKRLENRKDFNITKMNWSSGIILMTKLR
ncbi:class I SAM-dependent methyltransferase [Algoriphagus sp. D3-2-R+10]|uniref:O-methyltransferase n=1 Tax=Algoriphagus aurantiacus TaxID=3103948 RepID=UPI002B381B4E|nr:class I SAM-dependent methyltransferase [Algoriphagus sp. D3-2-R+10]MEB2777240.1 class I SAM-dependent methyltransferase [Algoriphagus sp. D3-2-R+10]